MTYRGVVTRVTHTWCLSLVCVWGGGGPLVPGLLAEGEGVWWRGEPGGDASHSWAAPRTHPAGDMTGASGVWGQVTPRARRCWQQQKMQKGRVFGWCWTRAAACGVFWQPESVPTGHPCRCVSGVCLRCVCVCTSRSLQHNKPQGQQCGSTAAWVQHV